MLAHVRKIFKFAHIPIDFELLDLSSKDPGNDALENAITSIKRNGVAIKVLSVLIVYLPIVYCFREMWRLNLTIRSS